ncbi:MAG: hypothetical protein ACXWPM_03620 [Bdellovibrionota bacterium]
MAFSKTTPDWARTLVLPLVALTAVACSHAKKKTPELNSMLGKRVALVDVDGEETPKKIVEVALINQLVQKGTFELISKQDVDAARNVPEQDPRDWKGIARRAGAELALRAKVLTFDGTENEGYSAIEEEDSQLAAEGGEEARKTQRVVKVKSLTGHVKVDLMFTDLLTGETKTGTAEAEDRVVEDARNEAIHLPPKLRYLEQLSNKAFKDFFESYN